jgi:NAD(P)-dependent dehydrogenase (short-subunit alcohol dehydrogenase family)
MRLKPVQEQVVVVLGASSGIGRETALRFAKRGAKVVAAARSEPGLVSLVDEITAAGGQAIYAVCDVSDFDQVDAVAAAAVRAFGRIDSWVTVAAVSVYARFEDTTLDEFRRVMDVNFMGQVHGAKAALPHLRREGRGALVVVSSVESVVSLPLNSAYAASKHAVEGMVDALRRELMAEGVPISVTSVKPATINTPLFNKARNKLDVKPHGPPPFYEPSVVADCVLSRQVTRRGVAEAPAARVTGRGGTLGRSGAGRPCGSSQGAPRRPAAAGRLRKLRWRKSSSSVAIANPPAIACSQTASSSAAWSPTSRTWAEPGYGSATRRASTGAGGFDHQAGGGTRRLRLRPARGGAAGTGACAAFAGGPRYVRPTRA